MSAQVDILRNSTGIHVCVAPAKTDGSDYATLSDPGALSCIYKTDLDTAWSSPQTLNPMTLGTGGHVQYGWQSWGNGEYEFGLPNAPLAHATARWIDFVIYGPADLQRIRLRVVLTGTDYHGTMLSMLWRRFFKKATCSATELKIYADDGVTVLTTQALSDSGGVQTQGAAE